MSDIAKKALEKIKEEKITPEPKWKFLLKNWVYWGAFVLTIILGSISFSTTFFIFQKSDWDIYPRLGFGLFSFFLFIAPRLWIVALVAFLSLAILNFRHTEKGYRFTPAFIVGLSIILSAFFGGVLSYAKVGEKLDNLLFEKYPSSYGDFSGSRRDLWQNPDKGLLGGKIISKNSDHLEILDKNNKIWSVDCASLCDAEGLKIGAPARFIGEKTGDSSFLVEEIRPGHIGAPFKPAKLLPPPFSPDNSKQKKN